MPRTPSNIHAPRERGFSLVEVIIAMMILAIVVSGAAVAVTSSDSAELKAKTVADTHAIAEKAVERLRQDLSARTSCDNQGWKATAKSVKTSGSTAAANFQTCLVPYTDMRDAKGRRYAVSLVVRPRDKTDDGTGVNDIDGDLRDSYEVQTTVQMQSDSTAGRESMQPISVGGTIDWESGSSDDATIRVIACAIDRPDRALVGGECSAGQSVSRQSIPISVTVQKVNESTGATSTFGSITSGGAPGSVPPGSYRLVAPQTSGSFTLLKLDPADLRVYGSHNYTVYATYVRNASSTRVCTQINSFDTAPDDDGYEILATNIHWRRTKQAGYRSMRVTLAGDSDPAMGWPGAPLAPNPNRLWSCSGYMLDPVQAAPTCPANPALPTISGCPSLYRGLYDLEVEQNRYYSNPKYPALSLWPQYKLQVTEASMNCNTNAKWNAAMGGTPLISRGADPGFERPNSAGANKSSFYARMAVTGGAQTLCLRFFSKQYERTRCYDAGGGNWVDKFGGAISNCKKTATICTLNLPPGAVDNDSNCWNGADICSSCGGGGATGTAGPIHATRQSGGVSGGPNDGTVACNTTTSYSWLGSHHLGWGASTNVPKTTFMGYDWIGGSSSYYANFSGKTSARGGHPYGVDPDYTTYNLPDNPTYFCELSYFSAGSALFAGNGGPYRYYECLEVSVPGRPYKVRGRLLDVSGSGKTFYGTVGTALQLAPDSGRLQNHWNPYGNGSDGYPDVTGGGNWPKYNVAHVTGDPNCGAPIVHIDPTIVDIYETVVDEPGTHAVLPPPFTTNLGTDRVGV